MNFTSDNVQEFLESWGLTFNTPDGESSNIPYPAVYVRMRTDAGDVGGDKLARFVSNSTDTTDGQTYLTYDSWDEMKEAWDTFI